MPCAKKILCVTDLRHAEYYGMLDTFDMLYQKSKDGFEFKKLMPLVLSRNNILLAYRNIKANAGSMTAGTDRKSIDDIRRFSPEVVVEKVRKIVTGSEHGYRPKPVRRKEIPKPNGKMRPLGIPCIWDRLIQQCFKQILEPICEAKFSNNSYGFRPERSVEDAISRTYSLIQNSHLHYVLEFDVKGFFDNVNHSKLLRQLWTMGIQDKQVLFVIKRMLKAPVRLEDGTMEFPDRGTPQGGIISPLLANVVLNELDHWVDSQWQEHPLVKQYSRWRTIRNKPVFDRSHGYRKMRTTNLKEMYIIRYADDFRIFCRHKTEAESAMLAVTEWLEERLKLEVSSEKTRIVNVRKRYSEFLGFKIGTQWKRNRYLIKSHISDKRLSALEEKLVTQAKHITKPTEGRNLTQEIGLYDVMVLGLQNYYRIATCVSLDLRKVHRRVMFVLTNRLRTERGELLKKDGGTMSPFEKERYGDSAMVRFVDGSERMIYPVAYIKYKTAIAVSPDVCRFTPVGRSKIHRTLDIDQTLLSSLREERIYNRSIEFFDCRLSRLSGQRCRCSICGEPFQNPEEIYGYYMNPLALGGIDRYRNITLINKKYLSLLTSDDPNTIASELKRLKIDDNTAVKINKMRTLSQRFVF